MNVDSYHRAALHLVKAGAAANEQAANGVLRKLHLHVTLADDYAKSTTSKIAAEAVVRLATRTFLGGVSYSGPKAPELESLGAAQSAAQGVRIGVGTLDADLPLYVDGMRGGVVPGANHVRLKGLSPAAILAAGAAVGMAYRRQLWSLNIRDARGRRIGDPRLFHNGLDLLVPGEAWYGAAERTDDLRLPGEFWFLGAGHVGQCMLFTVGQLPYNRRADVNFVIQDTDVATEANHSTSILTERGERRRKTRLCAEWLEDRGFEVRLVEQRFSAATRPNNEDPQLLVCSVDNLETRRALDAAGFPLILDTGLGAESDDLTTFRFTALPAHRSSQELFAESGVSRDAERYRKSSEFRAHATTDLCGAETVAGTAVGIPFVGAVAAAFCIGQAIARINGYDAVSAADSDAVNLGAMRCGSFGRTPCAIRAVPAA